MQETPIESLLAEDLSTVDTSMPVLKGNVLHDFDIADVSVNTKDDGSSTLKITVKTTSELASTKGDMINGGWPLYKYIGLTPVVDRPGKRDYSKDDIKRSLAQFVEAATGRKEAFGNPERFKGLKIRGRIGINKPTEEFPNESNSVTFIRV